MKIGITGAAGYIGGALVSFLAKHGYRDRVLIDNLTGPVKVIHEKWPVVVLDFESKEALSLLSECDVILHLAAVSGVMTCADKVEHSYRTNVAGTSKLAMMCFEKRIPLAFASSMAVVGSPKELPVLESALSNPTHEYARQKAAAEAIISSGSRRVSPTVIARQSNVYGSYMAAGVLISKGNVLQQFATQLMSGRLLVYAPGTQRRDFIHIDDVIAHWEAIVRLLTQPNAPKHPTTLNVASGEAYSVLELAALTSACYCKLHPMLSAPKIEIVANPRKDVELVEPNFFVSRKETERVLGVSCEKTVESSLSSILNIGYN